VLTNLALGFVLSGLMGFGGYYKKALSKSGVVGAMIVGTAIFSFGGWVWGVILVTFFVSSSLLSFFKKADKTTVTEKFDKGSQRDLGQALANGGVGALLALLSLSGSASLEPTGWPASVWWVAFLGAMGTVNADTWATELGILSQAVPRLITTGEPVPAGTSGGVTVPGTLAALGGGLVIGLVAWALGGDHGPWGATIIVVAGFGGLAGALFDSLLGATVQAIYYCDQCAKETERTTCCATATRSLRGLAWLNNDWVNFISSAAGALAAVGFSYFLA